MTTSNRLALVIESDDRQAEALFTALTALGIRSIAARNADEGWQAFARHRPSHVLVALHCGTQPGGMPFLHKLNSEYLGSMPQIFLTCSRTDLAALQASDTEPTAILTWPISHSSIARLFDQDSAFADGSGRQVTRLRELFELTLLGSDLIREIDFVTARAALAFQVADCIIWGSEEEQQWPRATRQETKTNWPLLLPRCNLAQHAGTTVIFSAQDSQSRTVVDGQSYSLLSAPLGPSDDQPIAGIALLSEECRIFSNDERDSLRILAHRLSVEFAWMSAHNRLLDEHERLRRTALVDPMLGVWTRPALEQAIDQQLGSSPKGAVPLAIVVMDYHQLRGVNDRFGHVVGDLVLAHFARTIALCLRPQDQIGRLGGDELALLLIGVGLEDAAAAATEIVGQLAKTPFEMDELSIVPKVHVGVTLIADYEESGDAAFRRALLAVEQARSSDSPVQSVPPSDSEETFRFETSTTELLSAGATLGGMYRIRHEISRGAMGVVYRCEDLGLGRPVAIKVLRSDLSSDQALVAKFRSEATLLASLRHRNLVQVYSFGTERNNVYFVMELVEGEPISQIVQRLALDGGFVALDAIAKIIEEIADALDALHTLGIVHRDVKPDNILVDRINDRAVLVDVGIAKRPSDVRDAAGTPGFAAPESFMEADESASTDVYGLAATSYAILTGHPPFQEEELLAMVNRQLTEAPPLASESRPGLTSAVDSVLATALHPKPEHRYRSASAFAIALNRALTRCPKKSTQASNRSRRETIKTGPPKTMRDAHVATYRLNLPDAPSPGDASNRGHSRGAVFRTAAVFWGQRLGAQWLRQVAKANPALRDVLKPTVAAESWWPTEHLVWLLRSTRDAHPNPSELAHQLGAEIMKKTLSQFFGADPTVQSPSSLLKATESFWNRYHNWGELSIATPAPELGIVELTGAPDAPLFCECVLGSLEQIVELAGGHNARASHPKCVHEHHPSCIYQVQWTESKVLESRSS